MKKIIISGMVIILMSAAIGFCQDAPNQDSVKTITGEVAKVDWVGNKIVVRTFDSINYDEILFYISEDTNIIKGGSEISLADINLSDKVSVNYSGSFAGLKALQITVKVGGQ